MKSRKTSFLLLIGFVFLTATITPGQQPAGAEFYKPDRVTYRRPNLSEMTAAQRAYLRALIILRLKLKPEIFKIPALRTLTRNVKSNLPRYRREIELAVTHSRKLHIVVILTKHGEDHISSEAGSQNRAEEILEHFQIPIVGFEGSGQPDISVASVLAESLEWEKRQGATEKPPADAGEVVRGQLVKHGAYRYRLKHGGIKLVGVEDIELSDLMDIFHRIIEAVPPGYHPLKSITDVSNSIDHTRSFLALAILIRKMRTYGYTRGALVMGAWHGNDLLTVMRGYGIRGAVYQTLDAASVQHYKVKLKP